MLAGTDTGRWTCVDTSWTRGWWEGCRRYIGISRGGYRGNARRSDGSVRKWGGDRCWFVLSISSSRRRPENVGRCIIPATSITLRRSGWRRLADGRSGWRRANGCWLRRLILSSQGRVLSQRIIVGRVTSCVSGRISLLLWLLSYICVRRLVISGVSSWWLGRRRRCCWTRNVWSCCRGRGTTE